MWLDAFMGSLHQLMLVKKGKVTDKTEIKTASTTHYQLPHRTFILIHSLSVYKQIWKYVYSNYIVHLW